jgi:hypothetical protein
VFRPGIIYVARDDRRCNGTKGFDDRDCPLGLSKQGKRSGCSRGRTQTSTKASKEGTARSKIE